MSFLSTFKSLVSVGRTDPGSDIVPMTVVEIKGGCRQVRCETAGNFTGTTMAGNSRTVTMYNSGEKIEVGFSEITAIGAGTFSVIM